MSDGRRWNSTLRSGTPMQRGTPLERSTRLKSRTRIKARNAKRGGQRFPKRREPALVSWVRKCPCRLRESGECRGETHPDHIRTRGAGGPDRDNVWPLCAYHHDRRHTMGLRSFAAHYGVDPEAEGRKYTAMYDETEPPELW